MWSQVTEVLAEAFARLGRVLVADLPALVAMLIVLAGALLLAALIRGLLRRILARVGFDRWARAWGVTAAQGLAPRQEPSRLVARGAYWFVVLAGLALALDVLGASVTAALGQRILAYLPRLLVGILILLAGLAAARFLERSVLIGAVNRQLQQARPLALGVRWLVLVVAAAMALEHLGVGGGLVTLTFGIVLGGVMLAAALAVGLGARDAVARALERRIPQEPPGAAGTEASDTRKIQHL
jgi:hypothetical protein